MTVSLDRFCRDHLGAAASRCLFTAAGVGVVSGLELADGRLVAVKAHPPSVTRTHLAAVQTVQRHLSAAGIPAPVPIAGPAPLGSGLGTAETLLVEGSWADPHEPATRAAMAGGLAELVRAGRSLVAVAQLDAWPPSDALWPPPHDARFDFSVEAEEARWIDRFAESARDIQRAGLTRDLVIGHTDWRVENMRFDDHRELCAVYDWDSLRVLPEPMLAGKQAANFTTDWSRQLDRQYPTIDEALAFIADFQAARGAPFDDGQQRVARASLVYALAYIARCEHSDEQTGHPVPANGVRSLLREHGTALL